MKKYLLGCFILAAAIAACKKSNLAPANTGSQSTKNNNVGDTAKQAIILGNWKWSAEYTNLPGQGLLQTPASTGVQETLAFNADWTWSQQKNGALANTGTWSLPEVMTPAGWPVTFFSVVNSSVTDTARYDNFNFNTGFAGSYYASKDSLVFIGVNTIDTVSYIAERVYVK